MEVKRFRHNKHYNIFTSWITKRKLDIPESYPKFGFVVYFGNTPIAIAFLRQVEGGYVHFDSLISNPDIKSPEIRNKSLDFLTAKMIETAKRLKLKGIFAYSTDNNIIIRAQKHGFTLMQDTLFALNLKKL